MSHDFGKNTQKTATIEPNTFKTQVPFCAAAEASLEHLLG